MALKIKSITLKNFRGYKHLYLDELSDFVIIVGPNAVGKTNIIEAIQLLTTGVSFRHPTWSDVISWGTTQASTSIQIEEEKRSITHKATFIENEKSYEINGKKKPSSSIRGTLPCVLFTPDDLQLIKASSSYRRDAIDQLAIQLASNFSTLKKEYQQTNKQRSLLIKEGDHESPLFHAWDENFATHAARLTITRKRLFNRLVDHMIDIYKQLVPHEELSAIYISSYERYDKNNRQVKDIPTYPEKRSSENQTIQELKEIILDYSNQFKEQEIQRGTSLIGPHKDEIAFFINNKNSRLFASQGQQRTIVLTLKLAAIKLTNEILDGKPILLLDDVMSELDESHREALTSFIDKSTQTIITTTNLDYFSPQTLENATIVRVPIKGTRHKYE